MNAFLHASESHARAEILQLSVRAFRESGSIITYGQDELITLGTHVDVYTTGLRMTRDIRQRFLQRPVQRQIAFLR